MQLATWGLGQLACRLLLQSCSLRLRQCSVLVRPCAAGRLLLPPGRWSLRRRPPPQRRTPMRPCQDAGGAQQGRGRDADARRAELQTPPVAGWPQRWLPPAPQSAFRRRPPAAAIRRHPVAAPLGFKGKRNEQSREVSDQGGNGLVLDLGRLWVGLVARGGGEGRREEPLGFGYTQPHQIKLHIIYFYHRISTVVA